MLIETTRFGGVEIDEGRIITFPEGILGFPSAKRYAMLQAAPEAAFFWLQSIDEPGLAFVICDPAEFVPDYRVPMRAEEAKALEIEDAADSQVMVIVNKNEGRLTANLQGPLVIGVKSMRARQLVLSDKKYSTRHRLTVKREEGKQLASARKVG